MAKSPFKTRWRQLYTGLMSIKQFWGYVATVLLWCGKIPSELWGLIVMFLVGARSLEKIKDVSYKPPAEEP